MTALGDGELILATACAPEAQARKVSDPQRSVIRLTDSSWFFVDKLSGKKTHKFESSSTSIP